MNHQRFGITNIGEMTCQLEAVDKTHRIVVATLQGEHQHAAHPTVGEIALGTCVIRVAGQSGIAHMSNTGMLLQPSGQRHRILRMSLHAQAQGFKALQQQKAVEGTDGRSPIAETLDPCSERKGDVAFIG